MNFFGEFEEFNAFILNNQNIELDSHLKLLEQMRDGLYAKYFKINLSQFAKYIKSLRSYQELITFKKRFSQSSRDAIEQLDLFVKTIASKNHYKFYQYRYRLDPQNNHKAVIFSIKPDIYQRWPENLSLPLATLSKALTRIDETPGVYKILYDAILIHKHLDPNEYFEVFAYLQGRSIQHYSAGQLDQLRQQADLSYEHITTFSDMKRRDEEAQNARKKLSTYFIIDLLQYVKQKNYNRLIALKKLGEVKNYIYGVQLFHDVEALITLLDNQLIKKNHHYSEDLTIVKTDHPWLMLFIGTDVDGSCQHIDTATETLLCGYVMSWHVQQIAILNKDNVIKARSVLKMLYDQQTTQPVLHLEHVYPHSSASLVAMIVLYAKLVAAKLGLDLAGDLQLKPLSPKYPNELHCLKVNVAEYVDSLGGEQHHSCKIRKDSQAFLFNYTQFHRQRYEQTMQRLAVPRSLVDHTMPNSKGLELVLKSC